MVQKSKVQRQFQVWLNSNAQLSVCQEDIFHHRSVSPSAIFSFSIMSEVTTGTSRQRVHKLRRSRGKRELPFLTRDSGSPALAPHSLWLRVFLIDKACSWSVRRSHPSSETERRRKSGFPRENQNTITKRRKEEFL